MGSVTAVLEETGDLSGELSVRPGESITYSLAASTETTEEFVGTILLQSSRNGGMSWETEVIADSTGSGTIKVDKTDIPGPRFRFKAVSMQEETTDLAASNPMDVTLADVDDNVREFRNRDGDLRILMSDDGVKLFGAVEIVGTAALPAGATLDGDDIAVVTT
jgi:hypothetical protein